MIYKNMVCRHGRFYNPALTGFSSNENNWYGDWEKYVVNSPGGLKNSGVWKITLLE